MRNVARAVKVLKECSGEREQATGSDCLSIFKMEAPLQTQRLSSFLVHSLPLSEEEFGQRRCKVRRLVCVMDILQGCPFRLQELPFLGTTPLFREPQGSSSGCKLEIPVDATLCVLGALGSGTINTLLLSAF